MHGYLSNGESFNVQKSLLKKDFNVYSPDLKGFGNNKDMPYPYALIDYVNEVKDYIKINSIVSPSVIAHSFGGRVILKALLDGDGASLFNKIVLVDSAGLKPKKTIKKHLKKITFNVLKHFINRERLGRFYSSDYLALDDMMKQSFIKVISENFDKRLSEIKNPTLIVYGENDKETPLYMAKRFHVGIEGSKLIVIKNAGHFCFLNSPMKFYMEVKEFLLS